MPLIRVEMFPGRTIAQKRAMVRALTDAFVASAGGTPDSVTILIEEVAREHWAVAGRLASDPKPET
jgi:4-oxalocrotonate tautomerase